MLRLISTERWAALMRLLLYPFDQGIERPQLDEPGRNAYDLDPMARPETRPFKPASHEPDFWFDQPFPRVAMFLDLQSANGWTRLNRRW